MLLLGVRLGVIRLTNITPRMVIGMGIAKHTFAIGKKWSIGYRSTSNRTPICMDRAQWATTNITRQEGVAVFVRVDA